MQKFRQDLNIGSNIRRLRKMRGLTQEQVTARLQVMGSPTTRSVYSRYETGQLNIRIKDLVAMREIFNCRFDDFFDGL